MKILIIEDDLETAGVLQNELWQQDHIVEHVTNGREGLFLAIEESYDLMIIDRLLPELDGLSIVKTIRRANVQTPILFLTTLDDADSHTKALEAGADDCLAKPFTFAELTAHIEALAQRSPHRS